MASIRLRGDRYNPAGAVLTVTDDVEAARKDLTLVTPDRAHGLVTGGQADWVEPPEAPASAPAPEQESGPSVDERAKVAEAPNGAAAPEPQHAPAPDQPVHHGAPTPAAPQQPEPAAPTPAAPAPAAPHA